MIDYCKYSDVGNRRINEDSMVIAELNNSYIFAVADGLGGHGKGDEASKTVCTYIEKYFKKKEDFSRQNIEVFYNLCQNELYEKQELLYSHNVMRTTLAMVCIDSESIIISHIGDSRVYVWNDGNVITRTRDHSVPQILCELGEISESEINSNENRNKLTRVLGVEARAVKAEIEEPLPRTSNTKLLICTDGFWEHLDENRISDVLRDSESARIAMDKMIELVKSGGQNKRMKNNTAIVIFL